MGIGLTGPKTFRIPGDFSGLAGIREFSAPPERTALLTSSRSECFNRKTLSFLECKAKVVLEKKMHYHNSISILLGMFFPAVVPPHLVSFNSLFCKKFPKAPL